MKALSKKLFTLTSVSALCCCYMIANADSNPGMDGTLPAEKRAYSPAFPNNELIQFANAYGDRSTGAHGTFARFPANFETPEHIHTHHYRAIVLKGQMTNPFAGEKNPPVMGPGSFWEVKAGSVHTTACVSDVPCEFFMYGDANFDFAPTQ